MRVSERFGIAGGQAVLDFVDVDVTRDIPLFVDPYALRGREDPWSTGCVGLLQNFFSAVLDSVRTGRRDDGVRLLMGLREPNETHLGYSQSSASRGSGVGRGIATELWNALAASSAVTSGLLNDLEEAALLVEGVSTDRVSDITINVIRQPLIDYTTEQANVWGMPIAQVRSGCLWDPVSLTWGPETFVDLPEGPERPLLLVPKAIVRQRLTLDPGRYYRNYILPRYQDDEIQAGRGLVRVLKGGERKVYLPKKIASERLLSQQRRQKRANATYTQMDATLLRNYLADTRSGPERLPARPLEELTDQPVNWEALLRAVLHVQPGSDGASAYHRQVQGLLTALFYPQLDSCKREAEIDQGRKRVDLRFTNTAAAGFFRWLTDNFPPQPFIWCECKNYGADPANEALDQLTGRFSPNRGNFGLLLCRALSNRGRIVQRCRDAALNGRGYVLALEDSDLRTMVDARIGGDVEGVSRHLRDRFAEIVS